jgi:uncharacterized protein (DUF1697 family)
VKPTPNTSRSGATRRYVALLRGINVGGKNTLPMRHLAAMFVEAGCSDVRTYIQSGNVVFAATPGVVKRLADAISRRIAKNFGYRVPVVLRTADELHQVLSGNPFLKSGADGRSLHVAFLADLPDPRRIAALDPKRSPGDSFKLRGREIYLCLPNGVAGTKLSNAYFDSTLATTSTLRNWRTVLKLVEMTQTVD